MSKKPINLEFREPTIADAEWASPLLKSTGMKICEFSFTTIWMWRKYYNNQIARYGDTVFIRSGDVEPYYLPPVGEDLKRNIEILREYQHERGEFLSIFGADAEMKERIEQWFPDVFEWQPSEGDYDYLYNSEDLATLAGRKYHSKRNHIAAFDARYNWSYEPIDSHNADEVFNMVTEWCRERGNCSDPGLRNERRSIGEALDHMDELSLSGGLVRVDGRVVAMTMGSPINDSVFDVHSEKALADFNGAYAVINREFAKELAPKYPLINRENDMGIEGLKRAKRSYKPVRILEKYLATEKV